MLSSGDSHCVYESAACRMWAGERDTTLERVLNADAEELDVVSGRIRIWLKHTLPQRGIFLVPGSTRKRKHCTSVLLSSESFRSFAVYRYQQMQCAETNVVVWLIDSVLLYACVPATDISPSPFSSSVLVLIDVGESQQHCYFFGKVQRCIDPLRTECGGTECDSDGDGDGDGDTWSHFHDCIESSTELLADLHKCFPDVPLAPSARELLSTATLSSNSAPSMTVQKQPSKLLGPGSSAMRKRRRTISATNFYGGNNTASTTPTTPVTISAAHQSSASASIRGQASHSVWRSFYEKLQFRVSHSLLCQLEGTAPVSSTFPRQQEAFEFADQISFFRQEMARAHISKGNDNVSSGNSVNTEALPRVFSFEDAREGKRRFLVSSFAHFWTNYVHTQPTQRHVYEIIREGVPCRLYFDLGNTIAAGIACSAAKPGAHWTFWNVLNDDQSPEFKKNCNANVDGDQLVARLLSLVQLQLFVRPLLDCFLVNQAEPTTHAHVVDLKMVGWQRKFQLHVSRDQVEQLDSSTSAKFSRHLIFHFPNGELFADNIHAGHFVRELIHDLVENANDADDQHSPFLVNTDKPQQQQPLDDRKGEQQHVNNNYTKQLFIDTGVYTRNRMFRVLGSSKYRRDAVLRFMPSPWHVNGTQLLQQARQQDDPIVLGGRELFLKTLVCPFPTLQALTSAHGQQLRLLRCDQDASTLKRSVGARPLWAPTLLSNHHSSRLSSAQSVECRESMFPTLDAFILARASHGGVQGEIRAIQLLFDNAADAVLPSNGQWNDQSHHSIAEVVEKVEIGSTISSEDGKNHLTVNTTQRPRRRRPWMLIYQMARNRWCWNVRRAHKSNNVMLIVDLDQRVFYQKCHDQGCKAIDYRSPPLPLPPDLLLTLDE